MPKLLENQFIVAGDSKIIKDVQNKGVVKLDNVEKGSPADRAGLIKEDRILSLNGSKISKPQDLPTATSGNAGKTVALEVQSENQAVRTVNVTLNSTKPYLGVVPYSAEEGVQIRRSTWSAPIVALGVTKDFTVATFKGLGTALKGLGSIIAGAVTGNTTARREGQSEASSQVSGPVGIFYVMYAISKVGIGMVLFVIGLISLTLAIMNILPIPALDGGRLFVMLLFRGLKKPLLPKVEERIHGTGFAMLMLLVVVITVVDVKRFF